MNAGAARYARASVTWLAGPGRNPPTTSSGANQTTSHGDGEMVSSQSSAKTMKTAPPTTPARVGRRLNSRVRAVRRRSSGCGLRRRGWRGAGGCRFPDAFDEDLVVLLVGRDAGVGPAPVGADAHFYDPGGLFPVGRPGPMRVSLIQERFPDRGCDVLSPEHVGGTHPARGLKA